MSGIRILYVDTEAVWRGGQEQLFGLMKGMKLRGHRVLLAAPPEAPLSHKAARLGIPVCPFRQRYELSVLAYRRFRKILTRHPVDILHFNTPRALLAGGLAARREAVPVCVASRRVNFPLRSRLSRFKYNRLLDRTLTVSESIQQTLLQGGVEPGRIQVIYEGVDLAWIDSLKAPAPLPARSRPWVGTVAHLSPEKGHRILLEALARLRHRWPEVTYVFVGNGDQKESLRALAQALEVARQVLFLGFRDDSEALMKQFDLFCLPSLSEGLSSAILAAMASELPVVATRVGGIPELVVDGETGLLVPAGQAEALAAALDCLLEDSELRRRMGQAGRRRVETCFTLERKLKETEKSYQELLRQARIK